MIFEKGRFMCPKCLVNNIGDKYKQMSIQTKLVLWLTFCSLIQKGINIITVPVFTRLMHANEYGKVSAYLSWTNIFTILCSFNLYAGVYNKGLSKYREDQDGYCLAMQYTTSFITIIVYIIYLVFCSYINNVTEMNTLISSLMFLQIFFSTSMPFWSIKMQYRYRYKNVVMASLVYAFLNPVLGVFFVLLASYDIRGIARIISMVVVQVAVGLFFYSANIKNGKGVFKSKYSVFALKFNLPLIPHYFSEYILNQLDRIMIQKMCSYIEVAFYSVAYSAGMVLTILTNSLNQSITPWLYQNLDKKNIRHIGDTLYRCAVILLIPMVLFIAFAPEAILILAGESYSSAVYVIPPVSGSILFLFLYTNFANVEFYYDYNKVTMYISLIGAVLNIVLNFFFIRLFGYIAAAYTSYACYFVYCIGHYLFVNRIIKKKFLCPIIPLKKLLCLFGFQTIIMVIMSLTYSSNIFRYSIIVIMIVIIFVKRNILHSLLDLFISHESRDERGC